MATHFLDEPLTAHQVCGSPEDEEEMLLCDGCDCGVHLGCLCIGWESVRSYFFCRACTKAGDVLEGIDP